MHHELRRLLDDHQMYHDDVQLESFILRQHGGTLWGCYKQALRELYKRYRGLKDIEGNRATLEAQLSTSGLMDNQQAVARQQGRLQLEDLDRALADTQREAGWFFLVARQMKEQLGDITPEYRRELDRAYWHYKCSERAALDYLTLGGLSEQTISMVQYLPTDMRREVLAFVQDRDEVVNWFGEYEYPRLDVPQVTGDTLRLLNG